MSCGHGCCDTYREHLLSIGIGAAALPTRNQSVAETTKREEVLGRDRDAYQRLRRDGVQPSAVDGSAHLERHASTQQEIERGRLSA